MGATASFPAWADRVYGALLLAYPVPFREEHSREMRAAFRSRWHEERREHGVTGLARLWLSVLLDTLSTAARWQSDTLARDLRYAWRTLTDRRSRGFSTAALLTLAIGIGAVTAIFTIVHAVLLAPLPYREPDRVVRLRDTNPSRGIESFTSSAPNFRSWQSAQAFSHLSALRGADSNLADGAEPVRVSGLKVSANFWDMLGIRPVAGRSFLPDEGVPDSVPVAMIGEGLWKRRYGGDMAAIGRTVDVNRVPRVIIGIAPDDVGFASGIDLWLPLNDPVSDDNRGDHQLIVFGRLAPGVTLPQAQEEMSALSSQLEREFPEDNGGWSVVVDPMRRFIVAAEVVQRLRIVMVAVALLLLVAAINVANLQIARSSGRLNEIGVRLALGASRARLVRQMVTESMLLSAMGGAAGIALAWAGVRAAGAWLPASLPRREALAIDLPVLLLAIVCIALTALLTGLLPARLALRADVQEALKSTGRSSTARRSPARHVLVGAQLALATMLVVGAALLTQSLVRLQHVSLGFADPERLLTTRLTRSGSGGEMMDRDRDFFRALIEEVGALPGVTSAAVCSEVPFGESPTAMPIAPDGRSARVPGESIQANWRIVTGGFFRTMQIPLRRGRTFEEGREPWESMILSEGLARRLWPDGRDPIGRQVKLGNNRTYRIVGVVGDVRQLELREDPTPTMYISTSWIVLPTMTLVVRTPTEMAALVQPVRRIVERLDPGQPISAFQTMRSAVATNAAAPRLNAVLVASFAVLALVVAVVGVAGVVGYSVGQRTRELAVRLALGSSPGAAVWHVMRGGLSMCAAGILCGVAAALALGRALSSVLYGVAAHDPPTLVATAIALLAAATLACWLPARRATRISPSRTLREG